MSQSSGLRPSAALDPWHALNVAIDAARAAGDALRAEFHREGGPRGSKGKAPIDTTAEELIRERLRAAFPRDGIRAEEAPDVDCAALDARGCFWLIDPNDGTSAFLHGHRGASVSIARIRDGVPVLGVVFAYAAPDDAGDMIAWAEGCGSVQRNGAPIGHPGWPSTMRAGDVVLISNSADNRAFANATRLAPARYRPVPGIAYRLALAACGEGIAALSLFGARDFDYAAGHALLRGAGGVLFDERGREVTYHPSKPTRVGFCFGGGRDVCAALITRDWAGLLAAPVDPPEPYGILRAQVEDVCHEAAMVGRAQGCWLGQLTGDALGSQVEFKSADAIAKAWPDGVTVIKDGGTFDTLAGQATDDSEMAMYLARSMIERGGWDADAVTRAYVAWLTSRPFDIGNTVRAALLGAVDAEEPAKAAAEAANFASQANGALMRLAPIAIAGAGWSVERLAQVARQDALLTHPNPVCVDANALYAVVIAFVIRTGASATAAWEFALAQAEALDVHADVKATLEAARHGPPADFVAQQGWVRIALQNAFWLLRSGWSVGKALQWTVEQGGDTDTNACIAGALLGAVQGRAAIPSQWRNVVITCRPMLGLPGVRRPRPRACWPIDAEVLAERLLAIR